MVTSSFRSAVVLCALTSLAAVSADASPHRGSRRAEFVGEVEDGAWRRIDPLLRAAALRRPDQPITAVFEPADDDVRVADQAARLRALGIEPPSSILARRFVPIEGTPRALLRAAADGLAIAVEPTLVSPEPSVGEASGLHATAAHGPLPQDGPRGRGVRIVVFDSSIDVYHPEFFEADGGAYPWIDVDGDGALTPGIDAIDTDVDGEVAPHEVLRLLDHGARYVVDGAVEYVGPDGALDPAVDYLFVDFDGDGERTYGPGFPEDTPGYGEPLLLPDDADGDGVITGDERLLLLSTSKVAAVHDGTRIFERGVDLVELGRRLVSQTRHGTATLGTLVGGHDRVFRRQRGLAIDAEVRLFDLTQGGTFVEAQQWADDTDTNLMLLEVATWDTQLDGTGPLDGIVDGNEADGILTVCAAGNTGNSEKHIRRTVDGEPLALDVAVENDDDGSSIPKMIIFEHWLAPDLVPTCVLATPWGEVITLIEDEAVDFDGGQAELWLAYTERDVTWLGIEVTRFLSGTLTGEWHLECSHDAPEGTVVHGFLQDSADFTRGPTSFVGATPDSTLSAPATADACLSIGALRVENYFDFPGELAAYSSRGPRIDGGRTIDLAAPCDPLVPYPSTDAGSVGYERPLAQNNSFHFSGTSGASAVLTAAVAAMLEVDPDLDTETARTRLAAGASLAGFTPEQDVHARGAGALDLHATIFDTPAGPPPAFVDAQLSVAFVATSEGCVATVTVEDATWDAPNVRWDLDYDGTWDVDFSPELHRPVLLTTDAPELAVRVEYGSAGWRVGGASLAATAPESCFEASSDSGGGADGTTGDAPVPLDSEGSSDAATSSAEESGAQDGGGGCGCVTGGGGGWAALWSAWAIVAWRRGRHRISRADRVTPG